MEKKTFTKKLKNILRCKSLRWCNLVQITNTIVIKTVQHKSKSYNGTSIEFSKKYIVVNG